ncbi:MAG TPA: hypothetical protein PLF13_10605 [candidate division Zixibacteria bacterium]|nr:hypothetical protein [candidate division Zixibacteria bacterium]
MRRKGILLGFLSVGGQVLLLKELVGSFGGSEILIGLGLTGWLTAVALGSFLSGKLRNSLRSNLLFAASVVVLPMTLALTRIVPTWLTGVPIEVVPFSYASLLSLILPIPLAFLSGMLFTAISREGWRPVDSIIHVYLFEGIGSFLGGLTIALLVGPILTGFTMSLVIGAVVLTNLLLISKPRLALVGLALCVTAVVMIVLGRDRSGLDRMLDQIRYEPYTVAASFDTHYGHQTILERESSVILLTDGRTEAVFPDRESAETSLLIPMLQRPDINEILVVGRGEFGLMQLAAQIESVQVVTVDPRRELSLSLDRSIDFNSGVVRYDGTIEQELADRTFAGRFDAIVLNPGLVESYQSARFYSPVYLSNIRHALKPGGLLLLITPYDSERYVSDETAFLLAPIRAQLQEFFPYVSVWPGPSTWFLASDAPILENTDILKARIDSLPIQPDYIRSDLLLERTDPFRRDRLEQALDNSDPSNSPAKPQLVKRQLLVNARADGSLTIVSAFIDSPVAVIIAIVVILGFLLWPLFAGKPQYPRYGLALLFVAGFASLTLELISFYLFQTAVGYLYSDLAILIGTFMLGLSIGAASAASSKSGALEYSSLIILIVAALSLWLTHNLINHSLLLIYHSLFLLVTALATGSLFVAASRRYYEDVVLCNRGISYTVELIGSALAGLVILPVLLPLVGVNSIIIGVAVIAAMAFGGAVRTAYR